MPYARGCIALHPNRYRLSIQLHPYARGCIEYMDLKNLAIQLAIALDDVVYNNDVYIDRNTAVLIKKAFAELNI